MSTETFIISDLILKITGDKRVSVWQISLYSCLLSLWQQSGFSKQVKVSRKQLMEKAHFRSITTYHKSINMLKEYGYIVYLPTYDSYKGTSIEIVSSSNLI